MKTIIKVAHKEYRFNDELTRNIEIDIDDLSRIGWITIKEVGEENIYFDALGTINDVKAYIPCFCKVN